MVGKKNQRGHCSIVICHLEDRGGVNLLSEIKRWSNASSNCSLLAEEKI